MRINYVPSTSHLIFPPIIFGILVFLIAIMVIQKIIACRKDNVKILNLKEYRFFEENFDKIKLFGTLLLFILYIKSMVIFGFLISSIVFITMFNIIFAGIKSGKKSIYNSIIISSVFSVSIWFLFGYVFQITLP
ncbi:MAG: tripartite tricarboxylate transporter TctB family protein [Cetobacterium sp.]|uniref:tripartite tricarboxylate transporter TctB family protein n=1 Tax=Cetobacterium sp. ZWU0022 TaxID=1340502 RepID=UPI00064767D6|nr:tripartite tricarboxylate transporter TctB family protein [Cetobacterium sp. ZWU0022]